MSYASSSFEFCLGDPGTSIAKSVPKSCLALPCLISLASGDVAHFHISIPASAKSQPSNVTFNTVATAGASGPVAALDTVATPCLAAVSYTHLTLPTIYSV